MTTMTAGNFPTPAITPTLAGVLDKLLTKGRENAQRVINAIMTDVPTDAMAPAQALRFVPANDGTQVMLEMPDAPRTLHKHALAQAGERVDLPASYRDHLLNAGPWGVELLARNLSEGWAHRDGRHLIRSVRGEVRGILSDRFRRLDSRPIVEALAQAAQAQGLVPVDGYALDVRNSLKLVLPEVQWLTPTECVLLGLSWTNSDYGAGTNSLSAFIIRPVCANGMTRENLLREVHLGRQLTDNVFSARTYELDTQTSVSAVTDLVRGYLNPAKVQETVAGLRAANTQAVTPQGVANTLKAQGLTKDEAKRVTEAFTSADIEMMPAGATTYRLSNAISWVANQVEDRAKKLDLMKVAGTVLANATA